MVARAPPLHPLEMRIDIVADQEGRVIAVEGIVAVGGFDPPGTTVGPEEASAWMIDQ